MARRNTYKEDEVLETPFDFHHLLRASVYIKKYLGKMTLALVLSALGGVAALFAPMINQKALDDAVYAGSHIDWCVCHQCHLYHHSIPDHGSCEPEYYF